MIAAAAIPTAPRQNAVRSTNTTYKKASGLLRATVGSKHLVTLTLPDRSERQMYLQVQERGVYPHAKGSLVCLHVACAGKKWAMEAEMVAAHPSSLDMAKREEAHVVALWSDTPVNPNAPPDPECAACIGKKGDAPKACAQHAGGVCGLLTAGDA